MSSNKKVNNKLHAEVPDDDDDIFVVKQVKPVNSLTVTQALLIKHKVLRSFQSKSTNGKDSQKNGKKEQTKLKKKNSGDKSCKNVPKKLKENSKLKQDNLKKFLSPTKTDSSESSQASTKNTKILKSVESEIYLGEHKKSMSVKKDIKIKKMYDEETTRQENIQLSPGIKRKRNKFCLPSDTSLESTPKKANKSVSKGSPYHSRKKKSPVTFLDFDKTEEKNSAVLESLPKSTNDENLMFKIEGDKLLDNAALLCNILKNIISDVASKQIKLENIESEKKSFPVKLITVKECEVLESFCKLDEDSSKVYVRMLCRQKEWYRLSTIVFKDINVNLEEIFMLLEKENLISQKIEEEHIEKQLELLNVSEIKELCKLFNLSLNFNNSLKKNELIKFLIIKTKAQKSVVSMFQSKSDLCVTNLLKKRIQKYLGTCIKISDYSRSVFNKVILLFSFPHYFDEEDKRLRNQLYLCMNVLKNFIKFPDYTLSPTVVFQTSEDFDEYSKALSLQESFDAAVISKNYESFMEISEVVKNQFKKQLVNEKYHEHLFQLQKFLKRFSAGYVYARLLTKFCHKFKTKTSVKEIISVVKMLLSQNLFLPSKRGKWYEILVQALESTKDNKAAAEVLVEALKDPFVDEVQYLTLQLRGQSILKRKNNKITDANLKDLLDDLCTVSVQEPSSIEIRGKALEQNKSGFKTVYVEENEEGKLFTSVEERALLHYKASGFSRGYHVEGYLIQTLYCLFFFDIIYGLSPPGVFQSRYQEVPLDFFGESFYLNRKNAIDSRLEEMLTWTDNEVNIKITSVYCTNINISCIITWKDHFTPDIFVELVQCITMPVFVKICQRLIKNYKIVRSGFPDLTLWNPKTKKCKFVEVKSPNDKLSPAQRIWLDFLRKLGIDCEVCNVKNVSRKLLV